MAEVVLISDYGEMSCKGLSCGCFPFIVGSGSSAVKNNKKWLSVIYNVDINLQLDDGSLIQDSITKQPKVFHAAPGTSPMDSFSALVDDSGVVCQAISVSRDANQLLLTVLTINEGQINSKVYKVIKATGVCSLN